MPRLDAGLHLRIETGSHAHRRCRLAPCTTHRSRWRANALAVRAAQLQLDRPDRAHEGDAEEGKHGIAVVARERVVALETQSAGEEQRVAPRSARLRDHSRVVVPRARDAVDDGSVALVRRRRAHGEAGSAQTKHGLLHAQRERGRRNCARTADLCHATRAQRRAVRAPSGPTTRWIDARVEGIRRVGDVVQSIAVDPGEQGVRPHAVRRDRRAATDRVEPHVLIPVARRGRGVPNLVAGTGATHAARSGRAIRRPLRRRRVARDGQQRVVADAGASVEQSCAAAQRHARRDASRVADERHLSTLRRREHRARLSELERETRRTDVGAAAERDALIVRRHEARAEPARARAGETAHPHLRAGR